MRALIEVELKKLREKYDKVEHVETNGQDWFKIDAYPLPQGWLINGDHRESIPVVFSVNADYPKRSPYGFLGPSTLSFDGGTPENTTQSSSVTPFDGEWLLFSWHCEDWPEQADNDAQPDLVAWARSFTNRFLEGT